jgi:hypothetical protein
MLPATGYLKCTGEPLKSADEVSQKIVQKSIWKTATTEASDMRSLGEAAGG